MGRYIRSNTRHQEEDPLVEVNASLLRVRRTQLASLVVHAEKVVQAGTALPRSDIRVRIFERRHTAVLADLQELGTFKAVLSVAELP